MTIEEAISRLADLKSFGLDAIKIKDDEAIQLGIEALLFVEDTRGIPVHDLPELLPGETEK